MKLKNLFRKRHTLTLQDLVFEDRNKEYGAYALIKAMGYRLRISFLVANITFFIGILIFGGRIRISWIYTPDYDLRPSPISVSYNPTIINILKEPSQVASPLKKKLFVPPVIKDDVIDELPEEEVKKIEKEEDSIRSAETVSLADSLEKVRQQLAENQSLITRNADTILYLEQLPQFPGGAEALRSFIKATLHYPADALRRKVQGTVMLSFTIEKDGSIRSVIISKSVDPIIDFEAVRILESMPRWTPARMHGKSVATMMVMPISFSIRQ
jgi:protein TonB